jgi:hypothetical protein
LISFVFTQNIPEASPGLWVKEICPGKFIEHQILAAKVGWALGKIFKR